MIKTTRLDPYLMSFLLATLSVVYSYSVRGQPIVDSLIMELEQANDTARVHIFNALSKELQSSDPNRAIDFAAEAIDLAQQNSFSTGLATSHINFGNAHRKTGNFAQSIEAYSQALQVSQQYQNTKSEARAYNGLGIAYNLLGDYDQALTAFFNSLRLEEKNQDKPGIAHALNNIGIIYWYAGNMHQSLDYYKKSLDIRREIGDKNDIAASLNNIGNTYSSLGDNDLSLEYFLQALQIQEEIGNAEIIFALRINIGSAYEALNQPQKALSYYTSGLEISESRGDNWGTAECLRYMGSTYMNLKLLDKAESHLLKSIQLAEEIKAKAVLTEGYHDLAQLNEEKSNFQESLRYHKLYSMVKDSIFNETSSKQIAELETRYETEKNKAAIQELTNQKEVQDLKLRKSKNTMWFFIFSSFLIMILASVVYYGLRQNRKANTLLRERNKLEIENKERAISLFGQQVSKEVASELLSGPLHSSSKKLFACIMFLDIRDYTPFTENKEPSEIIQYQNDVFGFMIEVITSHHGIINQFLGDGFMATFGAPTSTGNDCENAVLASTEILNLLHEKSTSGEIPATKIGIGLHAGPIVTGNVGTSVRKQYSISGNTVVLASRIEQLNKKFNSEILISREVLEKIDPSDLDIADLGQVNVKGRVEPIEIFRIHITAPITSTT
ncbi:MAG: tetratricopeptide repeat protein [Saprospiraceae bacterium]|nr:tetratricopeptide repeat protein [Saprospiraceae bacterium]